MSDRERRREVLGACEWCSKEAFTRIWTVGGPRTKHQVKALVCDDHERRFIGEGAVSERSEEERKFAATKARAARYGLPS